MRNIGAGCRGAKDEAVGKLGPRERDTAPQRYARGSKLGIALKHVSRVPWFAVFAGGDRRNHARRDLRPRGCGTRRKPRHPAWRYWAGQR